MRPKFPKNRKKAFKGVLFDVYQWQQEMFDGSTATFEMVERGATVDIIATVKDKIMILLQQQPGTKTYPSLPGGRLEKNEDPKLTVCRELLEETGHKTEKVELLEEWFGSPKFFFHERLYVARNCKKIAGQNLDSGEKIKIEFVGFDEFLQFCRKPDFAVPIMLKFEMYEALLDEDKKEELKIKIFNKDKIK